MSIKNILVINGSAGADSSNHKLINIIASKSKDLFRLMVYDRLKKLPAFDPELSVENTPDAVHEFRDLVSAADGVMICTPEYIFSIPSGLKNAIEWCVSTTVFSDKPFALITASLSGRKAHEELQMIIKTVMGSFTPDTVLLIEGIKSKIDANGVIVDEKTADQLQFLIDAFYKQLTSETGG